MLRGADGSETQRAPTRCAALTVPSAVAMDSVKGRAVCRRRWTPVTNREHRNPLVVLVGGGRRFTARSVSIRLGHDDVGRGLLNHTNLEWIHAEPCWAKLHSIPAGLDACNSLPTTGGVTGTSPDQLGLLLCCLTVGVRERGVVDAVHLRNTLPTDIRGLDHVESPDFQGEEDRSRL